MLNTLGTAGDLKKRKQGGWMALPDRRFLVLVATLCTTLIAASNVAMMGARGDIRAEITAARKESTDHLDVISAEIRRQIEVLRAELRVVSDSRPTGGGK